MVSNADRPSNRERAERKARRVCESIYPSMDEHFLEKLIAAYADAFTAAYDEADRRVLEVGRAIEEMFYARIEEARNSALEEAASCVGKLSDDYEIGNEWDQGVQSGMNLAAGAISSLKSSPSPLAQAKEAVIAAGQHMVEEHGEPLRGVEAYKALFDAVQALAALETKDIPSRTDGG